MNTFSGSTNLWILLREYRLVITHHWQPKGLLREQECPRNCKKKLSIPVFLFIVLLSESRIGRFFVSVKLGL